MIPRNFEKAKLQISTLDGKSKVVAIFGLGDLGKQLALTFAATKPTEKLILVGYNTKRGNEFASIISACIGKKVDFFCINGLCLSSMREFIVNVRPDIIVQCASLVSPWAAFGKSSISLDSFRAAGFAANISAQLPIITNLMQAIELEKFNCITINSSYPDVTNMVLKNIGKSPDIGIGNVGMIRRIIQLNYPNLSDKLRVFAHHSQVWSFLKGHNYQEGIQVKIFNDSDDVSKEVKPRASGIPITKELNSLAASHALEILLGYLDEKTETFSSAPGVLGLPGGWPIRISNGKAFLDMPQGVTIDEIVHYQNAAGKLEGIEEVATDGTIYFTEKLQQTLPSKYKILGEPLSPEKALERSSFLNNLFSLNG